MKTDIRQLTVETTEHWQPEIIAKTGRIFEAYVGDASIHHHLAEVTPSIWFDYIGWFCENEIDDDTWEVVHTAVGFEGDYFRLSALDTAEKLTDMNFEYDCFEKDVDVDFYDGVVYEEEWEDFLEYCRCNAQAEQFHEKYLTD